MAPSKRNDHAQDNMMKDEVFGRVGSMSKVPASYIPLKHAEREYGLRIQVYLLERCIYTGQSVKDETHVPVSRLVELNSQLWPACSNFDYK
jgi:hypothetical protein